MATGDRHAIGWRTRIRPFLDPSAWILILITLVPLFVIDRPMLWTLLQWTAFAVALTGITIVLTRMVLPNLDLSRWLQAAFQGNEAAASVVRGLLILFGLMYLAIIYWAKA